MYKRQGSHCEPTPRSFLDRHRDTRWCLQCLTDDALAPPRLGAVLAVDYAPALRALFEGERLREAANTRRRFDHHFRPEPRNSSSATALLHAARDLEVPFGLSTEA